MDSTGDRNGSGVQGTMSQVFYFAAELGMSLWIGSGGAVAV